ncbi:MAG: hypothetical protein WAO24_03350 [Peptococcia bacterium]
MREYTMKDLKPSRSQLIKINKAILAQRSDRVIIKRRNSCKNKREKLLALISTNNWSKLVRQGKIIELGPREWGMEWDI